MSKNPTDRPPPPCALPVAPSPPHLAHDMRAALAQGVHALLRSEWPLFIPQRGPTPTPPPVTSHFHLAPELFLQLNGWTEFALPHGRQRLTAGQALLMPPQTWHHETVGHSSEGRPFGNIVINAEQGALSCHWAHEASPGRPAIQHLEARRDPMAQRVQTWLQQACAESAASASHPWAQLQVQALVGTAVAGVLRALDSAATPHLIDSPLVARVRVWVHNRLGDPELSVRSLAQEAGCTPDHLSHRFHRETGERLTQHITRLRMERAAQLIAEGSMAVKTVAWTCGYAHQSYFIQSFRRHWGCTPTDWQRQQPADRTPSAS